MNDARQLAPGLLEQNERSDHLDAAPSRTGRRRDATEQQDPHAAEDRPDAVVGATVAARGTERDRAKQRVAQRHPEIWIELFVLEEVEGDDEAARDDQQPAGIRLAVID